MSGEQYTLMVGSDDEALAGRSATALADLLRGADGVLEADRRKPPDSQTMDVGTIVSVIATSAATLALAEGIAGWLKARRGVSLTIEKGGTSASLKAAVSGIDPETALRIVELVRKG